MKTFAEVVEILVEATKVTMIGIGLLALVSLVLGVVGAVVVGVVIAWPQSGIGLFLGACVASAIGWLLTGQNSWLMRHK